MALPKSGEKPDLVRPADIPSSIESSVPLTDAERHALMGLLGRLVGMEEQTSLPPLPGSSGLSSGDVHRDLLIEKARTVIHERRRRTQFFASSMFGEPAWDMLLILYVTELSRSPQTIGAVLRLADVASATGLRWLDHLAAQRLVIREEHPTDRRSSIVRLADHGRQLLDGYFYAA